jgi:hypothetical protein
MLKTVQITKSIGIPSCDEDNARSQGPAAPTQQQFLFQFCCCASSFSNSGHPEPKKIWCENTH